MRYSGAILNVFEGQLTAHTPLGSRIVVLECGLCHSATITLHDTPRKGDVFLELYSLRPGGVGVCMRDLFQLLCHNNHRSSG